MKSGWAIFGGVLAVMAMCVALASATASAANGAAVASASVALMVNQCSMALLIVIALAGGISMGALGMAWKAQRDLLPRSPQTALPQLPEPSQTIVIQKPSTPVTLEKWGWK
jgi:hypothetical protein